MPDDLAATLAGWREITEAATPGPWGDEDSDDCWQLYGALESGGHPLQLIKAPKRRTPYAEYWPNEADAAFIAAARTAMPRLLTAVDAALKRHVEAMIYGSPKPFRYCKACSGHPGWPCPEVRAITAALTGKEVQQ